MFTFLINRLPAFSHEFSEENEIGKYFVKKHSIFDTFMQDPINHLINTKKISEWTVSDLEKVIESFGVNEAEIRIDKSFLRSFLEKYKKSKDEDNQQENDDEGSWSENENENENDDNDEYSQQQQQQQKKNKNVGEILIFKNYKRENGFWIQKFLLDHSKYFRKNPKRDPVRSFEQLRLFFQVFYLFTEMKRKDRFKLSEILVILKFQSYLARLMNNYLIKKNEVQAIILSNNNVNIDFIRAFMNLDLDISKMVSSNGTLRIFYVITDSLSRNENHPIEMDVKEESNEYSPFLARFSFGVFHEAIMIGETIFEWTDTAFVSTNDVSIGTHILGNRYPKLVLSGCVKDLSTNQRELKKLKKRLENLLNVWNTRRLYCRTTVKDRKPPWYFTHKQFFQEIKNCISSTIFSFEEDESSIRLLERLRNKQDLAMNSLYGCFSEKFHLFLTENENMGRIFKKLEDCANHKEFDLVYSEFSEEFSKTSKYEKKEFKKEFKDDYLVFKGVDNGFWMRRQNAQKKIASFKNSTDFQKYNKNFQKEMGVDLKYNPLENCPFIKGDEYSKMIGIKRDTVVKNMFELNKL